MVYAKKNSKICPDVDAQSYPGFRQINGTHPLREAVPNSFVD